MQLPKPLDSEFLQDDNGAKSAMRLIMFVVVFTVLGIWIAGNILAWYKNVHCAIKDPIDILDMKEWMVFAIIGVIGGKFGQKYFEKKNGNGDQPAPQPEVEGEKLP